MLFISDPRKRPLRSSIVVIAIASSLSLFIVLSSLSIGIKESSKEALDAAGADIYVVPEALNPLLKDLQTFSQGWAVMKEISDHDPSPVNIAPRLKDTVFYLNEGDLDETVVHGIVPRDESGFGQFDIIKGAWFGDEDDPLRDEYQSSGDILPTSMTGELLISEALMKDTGMDIGDLISVTARYSSDTLFEYRIIGIFLDTISSSSRAMMMHLGELQYIKGHLRMDNLTEILIDYDDGTDLDAIMKWSEEGDFLFKDNVDLYMKEDFLSEIYKFISILDGFSLIVISVTLIVCLIFTSTIFMISTKQRSLDMAILRAIGFHPMRVLYFVTREAVIYYMAGAVAGILIAISFNKLLNAGIKGFADGLPSDFQPFSSSPGLLLITLFMALVLAVLSSIVPAVISARRSPIEAIRGDL